MNPASMQALDSQDFLGVIQRKSEFMAKGHQAGLDAAPDLLQADGLLFTGMGGSGIGSYLVKDACTRVLDLPFSIVQHYQFPHHVKQDWHCLAVSYSGSTEETLSVARDAVRRNVPVTAFSTGGALADLADTNVLQPAGYQPRQLVAHAWFSLLGYLEGSRILGAKVPLDDAVAAVRDVDAACGPDIPEADNPAKQIARHLHDKIPQIYATPAFYGVAGFFRAMLNENAKKIAGVERVPECNHNDFTGWGGDPNRDHFAVLALSHAEQNPEIQKRLTYMEERYHSWGLPWHHERLAPIHSFEAHIIEQARAVQLLDYAAYYTSMLRGVDPAEIREILGLKAYLRGQE